MSFSFKVIFIPHQDHEISFPVFFEKKDKTGGLLSGIIIDNIYAY
jgi:hypothetical protein